MQTLALFTVGTHNAADSTDSGYTADMPPVKYKWFSLS